jgi:hypothetical protein
MNIGKPVYKNIQQPLYVNLYHPIDKHIHNLVYIKKYDRILKQVRVRVSIPIMNIVTNTL